MQRPCGPRVSKKTPDAYGREELVAIAKKKNIKGYSKMSIKELCNVLNLRKRTPIKKPSPGRRLSPGRNRPCGPRVSKKTPNAYSRDELLALANGMGIIGANKMNIPELCRVVFRKSKEKKTYAIQADRPCGPRVSKANPTAYSKEELVTMATEQGIRGAPKMKVEDLCRILFARPLEPSDDEVEEKRPINVPILYNRPCITQSKQLLRDYQQIAAKIFTRNKRGVLVAFGMGTGKTLLAVAATQCVLNKNPDWSVIVATPLSVVDNFKNAIDQYGISDKQYNVISHGQLFSAYETVSVVNGKKDPEEMKRYFQNKVLVIDEAHNLRGVGDEDSARGKKMTACFVDVCKYASKVMLLSGTPIVNTPLDMIPLIAMIDGKNPVSEAYFKKEIYSIKDKEPRAEFNSYFKGKIVFCYPDKKKDPNYPARYDIPVDIPMDATFSKKYDDLVQQVIKSSISGVDWTMADVIRKYKLNPYTNLMPFMNGLRRGISNITDSQGKLPKVEEVVKIAKTGQTVVYTGWLEAGIKVLKNRFDKEKIKYQEITGDVDPRTRDQIKNRYNSGEFGVLLITKAGGEGLDLKGTKNIVIYEPLWNQPSTEQVVARAIRFRSHVDLPPDQRYVNVYYLRMRRDPNLGEEDDMSVDTIVNLISKHKMKICKKFWKEVEHVSSKAC